MAKVHLQHDLSLTASLAPLPPHIADWSPLGVCNWLSAIGMPEYNEAFLHERIRGVNLPDLHEDDLLALGVTRLGDRLFIMSAIRQACERDQQELESAAEQVLWKELEVAERQQQQQQQQQRQREVEKEAKQQREAAVPLS
jgi:hypothetical protein